MITYNDQRAIIRDLKAQLFDQGLLTLRINEQTQEIAFLRSKITSLNEVLDVTTSKEN